MSKVFLGRQKIVNNSGKTFAHELLFRDTKEGIVNFSSNIQATSHVLLSALTHMDLDSVLGVDGISFINADAEIITSGILELLNPKRCVIEILEYTTVTDLLIEKIIELKIKGYRFALDDFDCSHEMIVKFQSIFQYINIVKIDARTALPENLKKLIPKFKQMGIRLLGEKIENSKEYLLYKELGFDLYQGYHIGKPNVLEVEPIQNGVEIIILSLISMLKDDKSTQEIETFIKQRPDLSYNIIKFINNQKVISDAITSIVHAITLMGRERLLRWLLVYLYSEVSDNEFSEPLLTAALARAKMMEENALPENKEEAFTVGMFSMLGALFNVKSEDIFKSIQLDDDIQSAIVDKKGPLGACLTHAIETERSHFKEIYMEEFEKIDSIDLLLTLEKNKIKY